MFIVLHGQDSFRLNERYHILRQAFIDKYDEQKLNVSSVDLATADIATLHQQLSHQGLFSSKRFIGLRGIEAIKAKSAAQLIQDLAALPDDNIVVCLVPDLEQVSPELQTAITASARVEAFPELDPTGVERWLRQRLAAAKVNVTLPALQYIAQAVGHDLWLAHNIVVQLQHSGETEITPEIVQRYLHSPLDDNIFHFTDAIVLKNSTLALRLLHDQLQSGAQPTYVLAMLARQIMLLLQVKENPKTALGHPYAIHKAQQHAQRFSLSQLGTLHNALAELDWQCKSSALDPGVLLDRWVLHATL